MNDSEVAVLFSFMFIVEYYDEECQVRALKRDGHQLKDK